MKGLRSGQESVFSGQRRGLAARINTAMCAGLLAGRAEGKFERTTSYTLLQAAVSCQSCRLEALRKNPVGREGTAREKTKLQVLAGAPISCRPAHLACTQPERLLLSQLTSGEGHLDL